MHRAHFLLLAALPLAVASACASTVTLESSGGVGGSSSGTSSHVSVSVTAASASASSSSGMPECTTPADCPPPPNCAVFACLNGKCTSVPTPKDLPCDDGLFCTDNDTCQGGGCFGTPHVCASPNECAIATCNEATKSCELMPANQGGPCGPGDACQPPGVCSGTTCVPSPPTNCSALGDACNVGACDPMVGCVKVPVADGTPCDDGNGCTLGTSCVMGACANATTTVSACIDGDGCCPAGCAVMGDSDCLWWASGVQQNVAPATMVGWTQCYQDTYDVALQFKVPTITSTCSGSKLMLACRKVGAPTWQLAAMGDRTDVLFDCGSNQNCTHQANGVGWYFSGSWSWGFANGGDSVTRTQCDLENGPLRLCWHTVASSGGYRCGDDAALNTDATFERAIFQAL